jgi:hypothetical protein
VQEREHVPYLECLHKADDLVHAASDWEVVDGDLAQDAIGGDDEQAPARCAVMGVGVRTLMLVCIAIEKHRWPTHCHCRFAANIERS